MKREYFERFERYYNGEMKPEEKESFEKSLSGDPDLSASYQEYLSIYDAISDQESIDLRIKLKEIREENTMKNKGSGFLSQGYNWLWMAALITIIISFATIVSLLVNRMESKQVAYEVITTEKQDLSDLDRELIRFEQRNMDFKLESPRDSIFLNRKNPLVFKWTVNSTDPLILELIDGQGKIVYSSVKPVVSPYTIKEILPEGIMVYRFRTNTEAYHLGFLYFR